jgi:hypothetical protein
VRLLHGETVADWRNVALIEHHDPKFDPNDPDADTGVAKTPPTYEALRTATTVYVEDVGGETELHDRATDPLELDNSASSLTAAQAAKLHATLTAIAACNTPRMAGPRRTCERTPLARRDEPAFSTRCRASRPC